MTLLKEIVISDDINKVTHVVELYINENNHFKTKYKRNEEEG